MNMTTTTTDTAIHITDVEATRIEVGDIVEQAGILYRVVEVHRSTVFNGIDAIYFEWTGSAESDLFRSVVNMRGYAGQIRWERPFRKEVA